MSNTTIKFKLGPSFENYLNTRRKQAQKGNVASINNSEVKEKARKLFERNFWLEDNYNSKEDFENDQLKRVQDGDVCATLLYMKSDLKQNISESSQLSYLKKYSGIILNNNYSSIDNIEKLPTSGSRAIYIKNGYISNTKSSISKSVDLKITYNFRNKHCIFYAAMKYISSNGGHQDNQFNDIILINQQFIKIKNPDIFTLSILDGEYFSKNNKKKLTDLNNKFKTDRNVCLTSEEVGNYLISCIIKWLDETFEADSKKDEALLKELNTEIDRLKNLVVK